MQKLVIFSLVVLFFSCKKESQVNNQTDNQPNAELLSRGTWPIVPGNYWVYRDSSFFSHGALINVGNNDTLKTNTTVTFNDKIFYGTLFRNTYFRQVDDSTTEQYGLNDPRKEPIIIFRQVKNNNTVVWSKEHDAEAIFDGTSKKYHIVDALTAFTDITTINGYDCIRNEVVSSFSGKIAGKTIIYVKPGVGMVRFLQYQLKNDRTGDLYLSLRIDLLSYKLK
jgi:hypothetical protein